MPVARDPAVDIEVLLVEHRLLNEEITITGATPPVTIAPSATPVTPLEVRRIAGAGENVFRVLQRSLVWARPTSSAAA